MINLLTDLRASSCQAPEPMALLTEAFDQLLVCEHVCLRAAEACLATPRPEALADCVEGMLRCAEACAETVLQILRHPTVIPGLQLQVCADACAACIVICTRHGKHSACRVCAIACRRCQQRCMALALSAPPAAANN